MVKQFQNYLKIMCCEKICSLFLIIAVIAQYFLIPSVALGEVPVYSNPILSQACGLDVVLVIDRSGSIDVNEVQQEKNAFVALIDDLAGTPTEFAVIGFNTTAAIQQGFTIDSNLAKNAVNSFIVAPNTATNWEDALVKSKIVLPNKDCKQNLIIFASDGNPTVNNSAGGMATKAKTDGKDLINAILVANDVKQAYNTRIVTLGVGDDVNEANLRKISGNVAGDHYNVADFEELKIALRDLAAGMCGGTITVGKFIGKEGNWVPAGAGWEFNVGGTAAATKAENDGKTDPVSLDAGTHDVVETPQADYTLVNGVCSISNNGGASLGTFDLANNRVKDIDLGVLDIVSCSFYNAANCQKIYGAEMCYDNGWARKSYTWNFPQFCEAAGSEEYEKHQDCDCEESSTKDCTGPRTSTTSYTYNFSYCPAKGDLVNDDDADCESTWTCLDWANAECVSNDEGGKRKQTQSCTDQYGGAKTNEQIVGDATCGCSQTETGRACFADGMARVEYSLGGQSYCSVSYTHLTLPTNREV